MRAKIVVNRSSRLMYAWTIYRTDKLGMFGLALLLSIALSAVAAPTLPLHEPDSPSGVPLDPPSPEHLLGTDYMGRDVLSRLLHGARVSLLIGLTASVLATVLGSAIGLVSGYFGGLVDTVLMRITDMFLQLPTLPLLLIFVALLGKGIQNIILVLVILSWPAAARIVRSETLSLRERAFVLAARALGATDARIIFVHIAPNAIPLLLAVATLGVVDAVFAESFLSFLGFGDPRVTSWGMLLYHARLAGAIANGYWWLVVPPGIMIMLLALSFASISRTIEHVVNPRLRARA